MTDEKKSEVKATMTMMDGSMVLSGRCPTEETWKRGDHCRVKAGAQNPLSIFFSKAVALATQTVTGCQGHLELCVS